MNYCVNCKHHKIGPQQLHVCVNTELVTISPVTGKVIPIECEWLRDAPGYVNTCRDGKYFEPTIHIPEELK
jgi:hypothetical protein